MVQYNNWNINQDSLFYELNELFVDGLINELGVETLNFAFAIQYGSRSVPSFLENKSTKDVAKYIYSLYSVQWKRLQQIVSHETNMEIGVESETTITENNLNKSNRNVSSATTNKISAFNDDALTDNNNSDESVLDIEDKTSNKSYTQIKKSLSALDFNRKIVENKSVVDIVCQDVARVIVLSIY